MTVKELTSLQHPKVKHLVKLRESKDYRNEQQRVALSGLKLIGELSPRVHIRTLFLEMGGTPPFQVQEGCDVFYVSPQILKKITGLEGGAQIAAEIDMLPPTDLSFSKFLLILDGISDPGNLGTLLRTACGLGWDGVFLTSQSTDPYNEKAIRAAKGATFSLPWKRGTWEELKILLDQQKMTLFAADAKGKKVDGLSFTSPLALALGNEAHGLTPQLKEHAQLLSIPMMDRMESLNVAAAGAVLMYVIREGLK